LLAQGRVRAALRAYEDAVGARPDFVTARPGRLRALIGLDDETGAVIEARFLCRLLEQRGDDERVPDVQALVVEAFPMAREQLAEPGDDDLDLVPARRSLPRRARRN
jgi:hypothetical protein